MTATAEPAREFSAGGRVYRWRLLPADEQWRLLRRLQRTLPALQGLDANLRQTGAGAGSLAGVVDNLKPLLSADEADIRAVFHACLAACEEADGDSWRAVAATPSLPVLLHIAATVVAGNLGAFFTLERPTFAPSPSSGAQYVPVALPGDEDFLFRPALRGLCRVESIYDGTLRLEHFARMNDAIDVEVENQERMQAAIRKMR